VGGLGVGDRRKGPFLRAPISNRMRVGSAQAEFRAGRSPPKPELGDNASVAFDVVSLEVVEQAPPFAYQL
jgi:hypothetical protein